MAAFYLDENVSLALATALRYQGYTATSTSDERRAGASDPHQLLYAAQHHWTIVTHNRRDFKLLQMAWQLWTNEWQVSFQHAGILVLEQAGSHTTATLTDAIQELLTDPTTVLSNALYDWRPTTGWMRFQ